MRRHILDALPVNPDLAPVPQALDVFLGSKWLRSRQVLNQEQRLVDCAEGAVDKHLDGHARSGVEAFHLRGSARARQLRLVEVAHSRVLTVGKRRLAGNIAIHEERVAAVIQGARLGRLHLQPTNRLVADVAPRMPDARANQSEMAGA
jgi:hypothetical protein